MNKKISNESENKILIVGSGAQDSLENMYLRAFKLSTNVNITLFDVTSVLRFVSFSRLLSRAMRLVRSHLIGLKLRSHLTENKYNVIIVFKGMQFSPRLLMHLRKISKNTLWLNLNPDDPYNLDSPGSSNLNVFNSINIYDYYCIWSKSIKDRIINEFSSKVIYLPFGFDVEFHSMGIATEKISKKEQCVSFVGSWDKEREMLLNELAQSGIQLRIYGNNWNRANSKSALNKFIINKNIFGQELANVISTSEICLNMLRQQNHGSHNMRTFEIVAMGGLMLTNRTEEQHEFFPEGEACYMYSDVFELKNKINYIFSNPIEAQKVRERGLELVTKHSYVHRVKLLLENLENS